MGELINLNSAAPIADADIPAGIARDTEFANADAAHVAALNPHPQYLLNNFTGLEFGENSVNAIDFHTGDTYKDFDARIFVSGGGASNGLAVVLLQAGHLRCNAKFSVNDGSQLSRLLSVSVTIDLPLIAAGGIAQITQTVVGAVLGDMCLFTPTQMPQGLTLFKIMAMVSSGGVATIYFHNLSTSALDVSAFSGRLLVIGFG